MDILKEFTASGNADLDALLKFTAEIDKMTGIFRRTILLDRSRAENDAEHSWHIAVMAMLFEKYAVEKVNVSHAVEMLLVHDLVEIYAGDTFAYDEEGIATKAEREQQSADRLFSQISSEQGTYLRKLWEEFDEGITADARYSNCLDRLQPFLHNVLTEGYTWRNAEVPPVAAQVEKRMSLLEDFMPEVHKWVRIAIDNAIQKKWLEK